MDLEAFALASYTPRGFYIQLNEPFFTGPSSPDGTLVFTQQNLPVFMHEVAHLVQDRATFRGVIDFLDLWDRVSAIAEHVRSSNPTIELPLVDIPSGFSRLAGNINWAVETEKIRRLREPRINWASGDRAWAYIRYETHLVPISLGNRRLKFPQITAFFVDNVTGEEYRHVLGAWEIKEAYSVAVSLIHGGLLPEYGKSNFEYLVIERILNSFFGEVSPRQTVALCHWCLQDLAPANTLFSLIEHFELQGLPDAERIYHHARAEALDRGFQGNVRDILRTVQDYGKALGAQEPLRVLFEWYLEHSTRLLNLHLDEARLFPLDTFLCNGNPYDVAHIQNSGFKQFFREVEVPLIVWPNGDTTSISSDSNMAATAVFLNQSVFDLSYRLWNSQSEKWPCPNFQGCHFSTKDNQTCQNSPWRQLLHTPTCPYGAAAKLMALDESTEILARSENSAT